MTRLISMTRTLLCDVKCASRRASLRESDQLVKIVPTPEPRYAWNSKTDAVLSISMRQRLHIRLTYLKNFKYIYRLIAAPRAPAPLKAAAFVTTTSTGYFQRMNFENAGSFWQKGFRKKRSRATQGVGSTHTNRQLFDQSTSPNTEPRPSST